MTSIVKMGFQSTLSEVVNMGMHRGDCHMVIGFTQYCQLSCPSFPHNINFHKFYKTAAFDLSHQLINVNLNLTVGLPEGQQFF